ncbi:MAG: aminotransferase class V-fold PLP-dependent enzyme [Bryobacterales bacterium]|nr:aminotransferase class V-fold PLP-dependent enzyme [Bryobacteraceae bacterium]MDW8354370.1 aminotransferase class V-fold PLP-dependent enzyme [Bryobacterales bacterium]
MAVDWRHVRSEFPALTRWTFLDTATFGQLPRRAVEAVARHFAHRDELACSDFLAWFDDADRLRALLGRLVGANPEDIAFIPNAATALGLLVEKLPWRRGDRVVTLRDEFPNNLYAAAVLGRRGVEPLEAGWPELLGLVDARTRLVIVSSVNYVTGFRVPLAEVAAAARAAGALLYVDGTQSVGALRLDVRRCGVDMLAVHGYKWLLCPNGAGFMYVAPKLRAMLEPAVVGWRSHRDWRQVDALHHGAPEWKPDAERYEGGMLSFPLLYAMAASVGLMLEIGPEAIEERVLELAARVREALRGLGARLPADEAPHFDSPVIAAEFAGRDAPSLARALRHDRVLVSARHGFLRVSPHFYNDEADIARLEEGLRRLL